MADYFICPSCGRSDDYFQYCYECGQIFCSKCVMEAGILNGKGMIVCPCCGEEFNTGNVGDYKLLRDTGGIVAGHYRTVYERYKRKQEQERKELNSGMYHQHNDYDPSPIGQLNRMIAEANKEIQAFNHQMANKKYNSQEEIARDIKKFDELVKTATTLSDMAAGKIPISTPIRTPIRTNTNTNNYKVNNAELEKDDVKREMIILTEEYNKINDKMLKLKLEMENSENMPLGVIISKRNEFLALSKELDELDKRREKINQRVYVLENTQESSDNLSGNTKDSVDIPDEVITNECLEECLEKYSSAKHINLKNAKKFDEGFLDFCIFYKDVESIILSPNLEVIPISCFSSCENLKQINLENVKIIEGFAFEDCTSLQKIDLRNAIRIEGFAFQNCKNLETVYINESAEIDDYAFEGCENAKIIVGSTNTGDKFKQNTIQMSENNDYSSVSSNSNSDSGSGKGGCLIFVALAILFSILLIILLI